MIKPQGPLRWRLLPDGNVAQVLQEMFSFEVPVSEPDNMIPVKAERKMEQQLVGKWRAGEACKMVRPI